MTGEIVFWVVASITLLGLIGFAIYAGVDALRAMAERDFERGLRKLHEKSMREHKYAEQQRTRTR